MNALELELVLLLSLVQANGVEQFDQWTVKICEVIALGILRRQRRCILLCIGRGWDTRQHAARNISAGLALAIQLKQVAPGTTAEVSATRAAD